MIMAQNPRTCEIRHAKKIVCRISLVVHDIIFFEKKDKLPAVLLLALYQ